MLTCKVQLHFKGYSAPRTAPALFTVWRLCVMYSRTILIQAGKKKAQLVFQQPPASCRDNAVRLIYPPHIGVKMDTKIHLQILLPTARRLSVRFNTLRWVRSSFKWPVAGRTWTRQGLTFCRCRGLSEVIEQRYTLAGAQLPSCHKRQLPCILQGKNNLDVDRISDYCFWPGSAVSLAALKSYTNY